MKREWVLVVQGQGLAGKGTLEEMREKAQGNPAAKVRSSAWARKKDLL